jgi:hypothetical protein
VKSRLVEYLPELGFDFERAYLARINGALQPVAIIGGVIVNIYTKPTLLEIGVACCNPLDTKCAVDWPLSVTVEVDNGDGPHQEVIPNTTADRFVVAAARHYLKLLETGAELVEGMSL